MRNTIVLALLFFSASFALPQCMTPYLQDCSQSPVPQNCEHENQVKRDSYDQCRENAREQRRIEERRMRDEQARQQRQADEYLNITKPKTCLPDPDSAGQLRCR